MKQLKTPILLLAFNRPEFTRKVFQKIREAKPKKLFVHIDGPRNQEEKIKVDEVKKIVQEIDWPCKLKKFFRPKNLGIPSILGAYEWFFKENKEGIILEDDAVPNEDFFIFCSELLEKYHKNEKIMYITGCNFQRGWKRDNYSYYFSKYPHTYGFATWRRVWKKYDYKMKCYLELKKKGYFLDVFPSKIERNYVLRVMDEAYYKNPNAIDSRLWLSILINDGLCIIPNKNLVQNIGFSEKSTHTKKIDSYLSIPTERMELPLKHPLFILRNRKADERYARWLFLNSLRKHFLIKTGLSRLIYRKN